MRVAHREVSHHDDAGTALVEPKYRRIHVRPPIGEQKRYPALDSTVLRATERGAPADRHAIDWQLITDPPVADHGAAAEKLCRYAMRWKIEVFHKLLKSGRRVEEARFGTAERLVGQLAVFCIVAWRVFWMAMPNRIAPQASPALALTGVETALLDRLVPDKERPRPAKETLPSCLI